MKLIHRLEPLFWVLFGAGGFAAALLLPGMIFCIAIAGPLGWFDPYATDYHRMYGLVSNPVGRLIVFGLVTLVLWHSAHHLRHLLLDIGLKPVEAPMSYALYGLALLGTVVALSTVAAL